MRREFDDVLQEAITEKERVTLGLKNGKTFQDVLISDAKRDHITIEMPRSQDYAARTIYVKLSSIDVIEKKHLPKRDKR